MADFHDHIVDETVIPFVMVQNILFDEGPRIFGDAVEAYIYMYLKRRAGQRGDNAYPSIKRIAKDCFCGITKAKNCINKLVEKGLIVKKNRTNESGGKTSNIYIIVDLVAWLKILDGRETAMGYGRETTMGDSREATIPRSPDDHKEDTFKNKQSFKKSVSKPAQENSKSKPKTKTLDHLIADFQSKGFRPISNGTFLTRLEQEYPHYDHDLMVHLLEIGVEKKVRSFSYLNTILRTWDEKGISNFAELKALEAKENKKNTRKEPSALERRLKNMGRDIV